jgi:hypothetical protein
MSETSTIDIQPDLARDRHGLRGRRLAMLAIAVVVVLGAAGVLGVRSTTTRSHGGGYTLSVTYPRVTRAGIPAALRVEVTGDDPITEPVRLAITASYLDLFDEQGVRPEPSASTTSGSFLVWEFDPPLRGRRLTVRIDVIMETGRHFGQDGMVALVDDDGRIVTAVDLDTDVAP